MTDLPYSAPRHAAKQGSLDRKLAWLREHAAERAADERLIAWARSHLSLDAGSIDQWCARAWWGIAAGELLRVYLYDRDLRKEALALASEADWSLVDEALESGGVILAASHLGPPKFGMNLLISRYDRPLILTNTNDQPTWLSEIAGPLLNPLVASDRTNIMIKTALHLRAGGLMYGAPDGEYSASHISVGGFNRIWRFSSGIPALARMLGLPSFTVVALWEKNTIRLRVVPIKAPPIGMPPEAWCQAWIMEHWNVLSPIIELSPENLRFLCPMFRSEFGT